MASAGKKGSKSTLPTGALKLRLIMSVHLRPVVYIGITVIVSLLVGMIESSVGKSSTSLTLLIYLMLDVSLPYTLKQKH